MSSRLSSDLPTQRHAGTARRSVAVLPPCDSGGNGAPGAAAVEPHNDTVRSEHGQSPSCCSDWGTARMGGRFYFLFPLREHI